MKKAAIYARVSTEKQAEEQTIESQIADLREVCEGFKRLTEYADRGWSGETLDRPDLDRLRADVKKGDVERLYIHSLDRLSRNLYQQGILVEELRKHGVEIFVKDKPIDFTGEGKLLFDLLGAVAEYEKWKILERTHRGRLYKARNKGIVGGYAPYGYRYIKRTEKAEERHVIDATEAENVRLIFGLYMKLKSLNAVRNELNHRGIETQRSKGNWCRSTIRGILRNESYAGTGYYGKRQSVETKKGGGYRRKLKNGVRIRDRSEWIPVRFPAIISEDTFRAVQQLLEHNYRPYARAKHFYMLSGLIRCARCNSTFTGETKNNKYQSQFGYYRCNNRHRTNPTVKCNAPIVRTGDIDKAVWHSVSEAATSPPVLTSHIMGLAEGIDGGKSALLEKKKVVVDRMKRLEDKKSRLLELYTDGEINRRMFAERMASYDRADEEMSKEMAEVDSLMRNTVDKAQVMKCVEDFCKLATERLKSHDDFQKRAFLWNLVDVIVYNSWARKAKIKGHIPTNANSLAIDSGTMSVPSLSDGQRPTDPEKKWRFEIGVNV